MKKIFIISFLILFFLPSFSQKENKHIRKGNYLSIFGENSLAEESYQTALKIDSNSFVANNNLGSILYKKEKYAEAEKYYQKSTNNTVDSNKLAKIYHNLGNSQLKQAEQLMIKKDNENAGKKIQQSIESYKQSVKLNHTDIETKYNLIYANSLLDKNNKDKDSIFTSSYSPV